MRKLFILLGVILFVVSCQSYHPLSKYNYYNQSRLYNEPLSLQVQYFGDVKMKSLKELRSKDIKRKIDHFEGFKVRNLVSYGATNVNPEYKVYLFLKENHGNNPDTKGKLIAKDTASNTVLFKKVTPDKIAYLYMEAEKLNNNLGSLITDGESIINSLTTDSDVKEKLTYAKIFNAVKDSPNYLKAKEEIIMAPVEKTDANEWMQFQYLATINSLFSDNQEYIEQFESKRKKQLKPILDTLLQNPGIKINKEAIDTISQMASNTRVVMLNENHWYPKHRVLAVKLLEELKQVGYTHLALEALNQNQDRKINQRGYPTFNSGYYIREPNFGQFIRKAKELGFVLVGYENQNQDINRELGQAQNIAQVLEQNPDHKVFVYAGLDHIIEEEIKSGKRMAAYFKELTGIDPLTINQADIIGNTQSELTLVPSSQVNSYKKLDKAVDYFIINNLEVSTLNSLGKENLRKVTINPQRFAALETEKILIKIYKKSEYDIYKTQSVPIQATLRTDSGNNWMFYLPKGNFTFHLSSLDNDEIHIFHKTIEK
ncbi:hypothetical protein LB465_03265 [Salegentibacter sp. LM13S]|uniref:hypothetical protein n=1 Tax=Salegentibacter lacus TaxID=2873599 RepID=UPI001CCD7BD8|nr:hypothetical protein [Salegentibacter lacus]MBZ9629787.1 hypothetical protein [Salegentibacter lacus]